jgi:probable addiction module antidote protein
MSESKLNVWDPAEHLETEEDIEAYLKAALEDGDPNVIIAALGDVARARGMTDIARASGLGRQSLYHALFEDRRQKFATVLKVTQAMGFRVSVMPIIGWGWGIGEWARFAEDGDHSMISEMWPSYNHTALGQPVEH